MGETMKILITSQLTLQVHQTLVTRHLKLDTRHNSFTMYSFHFVLYQHEFDFKEIPAERTCQTGLLSNTEANYSELTGNFYDSFRKS